MIIKFLDLQKEIAPIQESIKTKVDEIFFKKTNFILGDSVTDFETNFANFIGINYCVGVANGTDALEIAVKSLNLNDDDEVITQSNTYVSTCLGVSNNNLNLKLVDIVKETYQIDLDLLEKSITNKTKVIIVVHLTGACCDMNKLMDIVHRNNLILIEDCAQSHGALYDNKKLGTIGLLSTFSFYPGKNLGAFGDGGAICTNNQELALYIRKYRNNGCIEKYKHEIVGRNSRLDTIQAAVLDLKLQNLDSNNEKRRKNAEYYNELLTNIINKYEKCEIGLPKIEKLCVPVFHLYIIRTRYRNELQKYLKENSIESGIHYPISIYELECYKEKLNSSNIPNNAIENSTKILSLPMYPDLTKTEIEYVSKCIENFFSGL